MPLTGYSNTVTVTTSGLLLDIYTNAASAYSVRQLRVSYTGPAIRVRRSSDNVEQDIYFDVNGNLNTSALTSFCSGTNGFVTTWYDQSGNARNATQTTAANQPQIVSSGVVYLENGKPSMKFDGSNDKLLFTYQWANQTFDNYFVTFENSPTTYEVILSEGNGLNSYLGLGTRNTGLFSIFYTGNYSEDYSSSSVVNTQYLLNYYSSGIISGTATVKFRKNGGIEESKTIAALSNNNSVIGAAGTGDFSSKSIQEILLYSSSQSSNRTGIESNINTYYGIY
jgi:hypothetical protein